ncbi:hypothetical protein AgCh_023484 [Apium graveolens]
MKPCYHGKGFSFNPFGKVINRYNQELPLSSAILERPENIHSPQSKWDWGVYGKHTFHDDISVIKLIYIERSDDVRDLIYNVKINVCALDDDACLRGGGVEASWTPMFSIDLDSATELYYGYFCSADFFLLLTDDEEMWILRNSDMKEFKFVPLSVDVVGQLYQSYKYTESLVSLAGFRRVNWNGGEDDN